MADNEGVQENLEQVAAAAQEVVAAVQATTSAAPAAAPSGNNLDVILDIPLQISVEVGRARMSIQDSLQLGQGSVVELEKVAGEALDIFVNGKQVARGEAVIVNEKFGVRILEIVSAEDRVQRLG